MDNIRYGKLDATEEEVIRAAKLANAHDFIMKLPDGYQTQFEGQRGILFPGAEAASGNRKSGGGGPAGADSG